MTANERRAPGCRAAPFDRWAGTTVRSPRRRQKWHKRREKKILMPSSVKTVASTSSNGKNGKNDGRAKVVFLLFFDLRLFLETSARFITVASRWRLGMIGTCWHFSNVLFKQNPFLDCWKTKWTKISYKGKWFVFWYCETIGQDALSWSNRDLMALFVPKYHSLVDQILSRSSKISRYSSYFVW